MPKTKICPYVKDMDKYLEKDGELIPISGLYCLISGEHCPVDGKLMTRKAAEGVAGLRLRTVGNLIRGGAYGVSESTQLDLPSDYVCVVLNKDDSELKELFEAKEAALEEALEEADVE